MGIRGKRQVGGERRGMGNEWKMGRGVMKEGDLWKRMKGKKRRE